MGATSSLFPWSSSRLMTASVLAWTDFASTAAGGGSLLRPAFLFLLSFASSFSRESRSAYLRAASSVSQVRRTEAWAGPSLTSVVDMMK